MAESLLDELDLVVPLLDLDELLLDLVEPALDFDELLLDLDLLVSVVVFALLLDELEVLVDLLEVLLDDMVVAPLLPDEHPAKAKNTVKKAAVFAAHFIKHLRLISCFFNAHPFNGINIILR